MSNQDLPVKDGEDFVGEFEVMDLSSLKDKSFVVGVSQGDRDKCKFLSSTIHGPYDFYEMCEEVGTMWKNDQHHAKVTILSKDKNKAPQFLGISTVDYIEAKYLDIITEGLLEGVFNNDKEFTCRADVRDADTSDDPRLVKKEEQESEEDK